MFRFLARFIGLWLVAGALIALVVDGAKSIAAGSIVTTPLGQLWYDLDPASLNTAQAAIERHVHPGLWDPVILAVLLAPDLLGDRHPRPAADAGRPKEGGAEADRDGRRLSRGTGPRTTIMMPPVMSAS